MAYEPHRLGERGQDRPRMAGIEGARPGWIESVENMLEPARRYVERHPAGIALAGIGLVCGIAALIWFNRD